MSTNGAEVQAPAPAHGTAWDDQSFYSDLQDDPSWDDALDHLSWALLLDHAAGSGDGYGPVGADDALVSLLSVDRDELSTPERVDYLVALQRQASRLAAIEAEVMVSLLGASPVHREVVVLDRRDDSERLLTLTDEMREELALALRRSPAQVHDQVDHARLLAGPLRATRDALAAGDISPRHAIVIAEQARRLRTDDDATGHCEAFVDACRRLEQRVLPRAADLTPAQTRALARRCVEAIDRDAACRRRLAARHQVGVELRPEDDGLALLQARLPVADAMRLFAAVEARARLAAGDDREATLGELRATALVDLVLGRAGAIVTAEIGVVVDLATLLGAADRPAVAGVGTDEPLDIDAVLALLDDPSVPAQLRRLVADPLTGSLIDRGRAAYEVTDAMRAFLVARDGTCRFPGCDRRAARCQMDHAIGWDDGGRSDRDNLGPLCVRHHQLKTHGGWELAPMGADGAARWRSPLGREHEVVPRQLLPDREVRPDPPPPREPEPEPESEPEPPPPF